MEEYLAKIQAAKGGDPWQCAGEMHDGKRCPIPVNEPGRAFCDVHDSGGPKATTH